MFVSKVIGAQQNLNFKSRQNVISSTGKLLEKFNYPYDKDTQICQVEFYRVTPNEKYNIVLDQSSKKVETLIPEGNVVDVKSLLELCDDDLYAYRVVVKDKNTNKQIWAGADTGVKIKNQNGEHVFRTDSNTRIYEKDVDGKKVKYEDYNDPISNYEYTLVSTNGTKIINNGQAAYLGIPDTLMPGAKVRGYNHPDTGEIYIDEDIQNKAENTLRTFSNILGGDIAGLISIIPYLKANGYTRFLTTPIANGDDVSSHSYWNKNNMQLAPRMGTEEDFNKFIIEMYKNDIEYVNDGTFTSEGLEGVHFQYALRWAQKNPQTYYWFRMQGIKDTNLGLGVIPEHAENLSHKLINAPFDYKKQPDGTYKKVPNQNYDSTKETIFQIFDASQVSEEQKKARDTQIRIYDNLKSGNPMDINTHDDTLISYAFQINPSEYQDRIDAINKLIKSGEKIDLYSTDGTILAGQFSSFKIDRKTEGGFVAWDANTDMVKMNYGISGYDVKNLKKITDRAQRYYEQQMIERGAKEVIDLTLQSSRYRTGNVKDAQIIYTANAIGKNKTAEQINKLVDEGILPEGARITDEEINNILNGEYFLSDKGILDRDSVTIKSLMKLPLDALEFGENIQGVLSTSYFSNRATTNDTIGMTRFELFKQGNPHLVEPYKNIYNKVDKLYENELKSFADKVIEQVNATSSEKLIDKDGQYTEFGEYVMEFMGKAIARYALLKSLAGENFRSKIRKDGQITYDYNAIRAKTTLKALGIEAVNPEEEASILQKRIQKGLRSLTTEDIQYVAEYISKQIEGKDADTFRIAEAIQYINAKGLSWRLDAAKDLVDMDAVRNGENDIHDQWEAVTKIWKTIIEKGIKSENPNAYIVAELTDIPELFRFTYGPKSNPYEDQTNINNCKFNGESDAITKFFNETGITAEAGYSYFFTNLLKNFAPDFEKGEYICDTHDAFKERMDVLMQTRDIHYILNLLTFIGNHDKTRTIQGLATDMRLFQSPITYSYTADGEILFDSEQDQRQKVIQILSGAKTYSEVPIELRLNVNNMDYFRTISPKAVAQAKTLLRSIDENLVSVASKEDILAIRNAIIDLANGNYLSDEATKPMTRIDVKQLSSIDNIVDEIAQLSLDRGLYITPQDKQKILKNINQMDLNNYLVQGDFDWGVPNQEIGNKNKEYLKDILGVSDDGSRYSLYTVQLARLVKEAYRKAGKDVDNAAFKDGLKDFINKYNRKFVEQHTAEAIKAESYDLTRNKESFGVKPFENAMEWVINQAEFKTGRKIENRKYIIDKVVTSITEPAIQKEAMIMSYLNALAGIPTTFAGDEYGMSGYEDKAKNKYLQNRNAVRKGVDGDRYSKIVNSTISLRTYNELHSLNDGTPYSMDVITGSKDRIAVRERLNEINNSLNNNNLSESERATLKKEQRRLARDLAKIAYLRYSANGDAVVTIFANGDVNTSERFDYFKYLADEYGIDTEEKRLRAFEEGVIDSINIHNKYVPITHQSEIDVIMLGAGTALPVGTLFMNSDIRDKALYEVRAFGKRLGIVKKDGGKIVVNGKTAKNGVMFLKKLFTFKGNPNRINQQYNIVSNPYAQAEPVENGKQLSILSV